ncbi:hypothetical protein CKM354_000896900 [Cercospora kikuchii]|uniref:Uncharacterized protein n=1 Tax=Cercospora kikuchii TaxID=84275 RepID=A0A9P3CN52_9PEZI|nr:uncharacterized protein CKM354_000896900 [Cercospora kikuchii]GIZ45818.1 hypothetical protein CKM354_000896900 [Cercospora kikuchii]
MSEYAEGSGDLDEYCDAWPPGCLPISGTADLCNITYSRAASIAAFQDYYDFLTRMYLDPQYLMTPPEGGWPEITPENLKDLNKTDEVIALLRFLPYVRKHPDGTPIHSAGFCVFADWASYARDISRRPALYPASDAAKITEVPFDHVPPHVIGLVESKYHKMFLDTHLGVIYFCGTVFGYPAVISDKVEQPIKPVQDEPHDYPPKKKLIGARAAVEIVEEKHALTHEDAEAGRMVSEIFRRHGWPASQDFSREQCMADVERQIKEHYPDRFFAH